MQQWIFNGGRLQNYYDIFYYFLGTKIVSIRINHDYIT